MKIGYIVDSSCGLAKEEADQKGWMYLPLNLTIDNEQYYDGLNLTAEQFYKKIKLSHQCKTSATPPGKVLEVFKKASEQFDQVIVYGLSAKLSSQTSNLQNLAKEFSNINVIDSCGVGYAITQDLEEVKDLQDINQIVEILNKKTKAQYGVAFPKTLKWLVKGGRISPAIANMANLLKIIPIIKLENGALDKYGKGRVYKKTIIKTTHALRKKYPERNFLIYYGKYDGIEGDIELIKKILGPKTKDYPFPPVIASHTSPAVIAILMR